MKFPCRLCNTELKNQNMLKSHFRLCHPENLQFECRTCHMEFDDLPNIIKHMGTHLRAPPNQCSFCLNTFSTKNILNIHYVTEHPGMDRSVCLICNKKYSDANALAKHTMVHTGERPYWCPFCYMTFGLKCTQVVHIRRHINYRPYKCQYCPKSFFNAGEIRKHERLHTGEKPYKCTICKHAFTMKETLTCHLKRHKKLKIKCEHCSKSFKDFSLLETHMYTHSGVKPLKCPLCTTTNLHLGSLRRHIISMHTDNLNTNCQICGQFEEDAFSLAQHILTHRSDYVHSKTQWFNYLKNATKSLSNSKSKNVIQRKNTSRKTNKKPRKFSSYIVSDESYQPEFVDESESKQENGETCDSDASYNEVFNQTEKIKKKRFRRNNKTLNKKSRTNRRTKKQVNKAVNNFFSNEEKYEDSNMLGLENNIEHNDIKTETDIKEEDEDDEPEQIEGIQEVEAPEYKFPLLKKEFECSICQEYFTSQGELLQHVSVHI